MKGIAPYVATAVMALAVAYGTWMYLDKDNKKVE